MLIICAASVRLGRAAIEQARNATRTAIASGLGWVGFAGLVANAGFAPYVLAAQLSVWVPLVSGPLLVSFLAVLVNPVILLAGIGAIAWLGFGRQASVVRSQMAARFCALLSFQGSVGQCPGLSRFLTDMRRCVDEPLENVAHANKDDLEWWNGMRDWLPDGLPAPAGIPPAPMDAPLARSVRQGERATAADRVQTAAVGAVTAGEIFWHAAAIDERVLNAANFSRTADLGDPLAFAVQARQFASHFAVVSNSSWRQTSKSGTSRDNVNSCHSASKGSIPIPPRMPAKIASRRLKAPTQMSPA